MPVINLVKPKFGEAFWKLNWIRGRGPQALALAPYPWGPLYRNKNENETKKPEQKQKRNKNTGTKTKTKQKYWKKNKQTQNTGKNSIKEDIPSSPGEYPWGPYLERELGEKNTGK